VIFIFTSEATLHQSAAVCLEALVP
jgi:hypothetical protein